MTKRGKQRSKSRAAAAAEAAEAAEAEASEHRVKRVRQTDGKEQRQGVKRRKLRSRGAKRRSVKRRRQKVPPCAQASGPKDNRLEDLGDMTLPSAKESRSAIENRTKFSRASAIESRLV